MKYVWLLLLGVSLTSIIIGEIMAGKEKGKRSQSLPPIKSKRTEEAPLKRTAEDRDEFLERYRTNRADYFRKILKQKDQVFAKERDQERCAICQDQVKDGEKTAEKVFLCKHGELMHEDCVNSLIAHNQKSGLKVVCPYCRAAYRTFKLSEGEDGKEVTKLCVEIRRGNATDIKKLLDSTEDVTAIGSLNRTALHYIKDSHLAEDLLKKGANMEIRDIFGFTPLNLAASNGDPIVYFFLENAADVGTQDSFGNTPLHNVIISCNEGEGFIIELMVKTLLSRGTKSNIINLEGKTPFDIAKEKKFDNIMLLLEATKK